MRPISDLHVHMLPHFLHPQGVLRRLTLGWLLAACFNTTQPAFAQSSSTAAPAAGVRPNVIILLADDQGYGDLECHGNPILKTPNLNRLHSESVRFTDFHAAPMCT